MNFSSSTVSDDTQNKYFICRMTKKRINTTHELGGKNQDNLYE